MELTSSIPDRSGCSNARREFIPVLSRIEVAVEVAAFGLTERGVDGRRTGVSWKSSQASVWLCEGSRWPPSAAAISGMSMYVICFLELAVVAVSECRIPLLAVLPDG